MRLRVSLVARVPSQSSMSRFPGLLTSHPPSDDVVVEEQVEETMVLCLDDEAGGGLLLNADDALARVKQVPSGSASVSRLRSVATMAESATSGQSVKIQK